MLGNLVVLAVVLLGCGGNSAHEGGSGPGGGGGETKSSYPIFQRPLGGTRPTQTTSSSSFPTGAKAGPAFTGTIEGKSAKITLSRGDVRLS
jgi:hypothetical protein